MTIRNIAFAFKPGKGTSYKFLRQLETKMQERIQTVDHASEDAIIEICSIMDDFFCNILGADYAEKLDVDTDDKDDLCTLLDDFYAAVNKTLEYPAKTQPFPQTKNQNHYPKHRPHRHA